MVKHYRPDHTGIGNICVRLYLLNQCCGSGMFIPDPNLSIPDQGQKGIRFRNRIHNQCCGSGMFIPDPDFYLSLVSDPYHFL